MSAPPNQAQPDRTAPASWSLERLRADDAAAWRAAFAELWRIAQAALRRRVFAAEAVDDLAQETLAIVAAGLNNYADAGHMRNMTALVATRKASHFLRDQTAARRDRRLEASLDAAAGVETPAGLVQAARALDEMLAVLDPEDRALLEGHFLEGLSSLELAARHGMNASTVRGRMRRAIQALNTQFAGDGSPHLRVLGLLVAMLGTSWGWADTFTP